MSKNILDRISVANPCEMAWEEMQGDAQKRYCGYCDKHVYNLSQMSRREAENLLRATNGKLCARFERNADGRIHTMDEPIALPRFNQKFLRLAATTMSAALSLSPTVIAKPVRNLPVLNLTQEQKEKSEPQEKEKTGKIYGTVFDVSGAAIPNAQVILVNFATNQEFFTSSSSEGSFEFSSLDVGVYRLIVQVHGFRNFFKNGIVLQSGQVQKLNAQMQVQAESLMGVIIISESLPKRVMRQTRNLLFFPFRKLIQTIRAD